MTFATKLAVARSASAILILAIVATVSYHASDAHCHGASHNAHGSYCQAVYQADYTAL